MTARSHNFEIKNINDLQQYDNNARVHTDEQINSIAASIKEFGFTNPVLVSEENMIIAGHGRFLAAKKLKIKDVPCVVIGGLAAQNNSKCCSMR